MLVVCWFLGFDGFWVVGLLGCLVGWQQPNDPTTQQPNNPTTQQPNNPTTKRQPNHPTTQPNNPATQQPNIQQPSNPATQEPNIPTTKRFGSECAKPRSEFERILPTKKISSIPKAGCETHTISIKRIMWSIEVL